LAAWVHRTAGDGRRSNDVGERHGRGRRPEAQALANSCRAVWSKDFGFSTVFGFDTDRAGQSVLGRERHGRHGVPEVAGVGHSQRAGKGGLERSTQHGYIERSSGVATAEPPLAEEPGQEPHGQADESNTDPVHVDLGRLRPEAHDSCGAGSASPSGATGRTLVSASLPHAGERPPTCR